MRVMSPVIPFGGRVVNTQWNASLWLLLSGSAGRQHDPRSNMIHATRIHAILYVRDQEAARAFYESVLGVPPTLHVPGMTEFEIRSGAVLGLMPERGIARLLDLPAGEMPRDGIRGEVYLVVALPESYHRRALAAGAKELSAMAPRDWGYRAAYSLDPDGYVLAFAEPVAAGSGEPAG